MNKITNDTFYPIYKVSLFLYFMNSMHPWFLLQVNAVWISLIFFAVTIIAFSKGYFGNNHRNLTILLFFLMFFWSRKDGNIFGMAEGMINAIIFASFLNLKKEYLFDILSFITKWLSIIICISVIAYILLLLGVPLPHTTLRLGGNSRIDALENYYLFVHAFDIYEGFRFNSIFLEPGYLTLGVAPLLFIHRYDTKNFYVLILLLSQLLSFSLAGLILLAFGFVYCMLCDSKVGKGKRLLYGVVAIFVMTVAFYQFYGAEYFNERIFNRLQIVDGSLAGDNRSSPYLDGVYQSMMNSDAKWIGTTFDVVFSEKGVAGYKLYAVQNGLIGVILVVLAYISLISLRNVRLNLNTGFILLCLMLLYQNAYPEAICILFSGVCAMYALDDKYSYKMIVRKPKI